MFALFETAEGLEQLGFQVAVDIASLRNKPMEAHIQEELEWSSMLMDLAMTVARHRVMACGHYMWNMPRDFVLALSEDMQDHHFLQQWLADCWGAWQGLHKSPFAKTRFWSAVIGRSAFQHQMTRAFMRQGMESDFLELDGVQTSMAADLVNGFCRTKLM